jgi:hypothetical protein
MGWLADRAENLERQIWGERATAIHQQLSGSFYLGFARGVDCALESNPHFSATHVGLVLSPHPEFTEPPFKTERPALLVYQHLNSYLISQPTPMLNIEQAQCQVFASTPDEEKAIHAILAASVSAFSSRGVLNRQWFDSEAGGHLGGT